MDRLHGIMQNYAWGSISAIANLRGVDPSGAPEAELWFGAHASAPSLLDDGSTLIERIEHDAQHQLGQPSLDAFGRRLPFLLKVLAADQPLSIQAHPSAEQARRGYDHEQSLGIALAARERSFSDPHHKPELIVALSPFEALAGFRDFADSASLFRELSMPTFFIDLLEGDTPSLVVGEALSPSTSEAEQAVAEAIEQIAKLSSSVDQTTSRWAGETGLLARLAAVHQHDPGVIVAALLNRVELAPGEGLFLDAGHMHAYVEGLAVEVMANSDNVIRGGLTHKHIDVPALLDIVNRIPMTPRPVAIVEGRYDTPSLEFALTRVQQSESREVEGPAVVLAIGPSDVTTPTDILELGPGDAAWIPASERADVRTQELAFIAQIGW